MKIKLIVFVEEKRIELILKENFGNQKYLFKELFHIYQKLEKEMYGLKESYINIKNENIQLKQENLNLKNE